MPPKQAGGRPRNSWTASRKRKLVRLYTLTTLKRHEIQKVLRAKDFNPSSSDVQKKLRALLPRDYAEDYRKYRPSNDIVMSTHLKRIQALRKGPSMNDKSKSATSKNGLPLAREKLDIFEGPATAFRNYLGHGNIPPNTVQDNCLLADPLESQVVDPSLLMLDGNIIEGTVTRSIDLSSASPIVPTAFRGDFHNPANPVGYVKDKSTKSDGPEIHSSSKSIVSISSLRDRLVCWSQSFVQHVHSIMGYSSSTSWRSGMSWLSNRLPYRHHSRRRLSTTTEIFATESSYTPQPELTQSSSLNRLLMEEYLSQYGLPSLKNFDYESELQKDFTRSNFERVCWVSPYNIWPFNPIPRACCHKLLNGDASGLCDVCGMRNVHVVLWHSNMEETDFHELSQSVHFVDYFNHTVLHFAAASQNVNVTSINTHLEMGLVPDLVNTRGETFLHVLFTHLTLDEVPQYFGLLRSLAGKQFPFSLRDYFGRTAIHNLFVSDINWRTWGHNLDVLEEILQILKPDLDCMDISGYSLRTLMRVAFCDSKRQERVESILARYERSLNCGIKLLEACPPNGPEWNLWLDWIAQGTDLLGLTTKETLRLSL